MKPQYIKWTNPSLLYQTRRKNTLVCKGLIFFCYVICQGLACALLCFLCLLLKGGALMGYDAVRQVMGLIETVDIGNKGAPVRTDVLLDYKGVSLSYLSIHVGLDGV